ncbi:MAG TPA: hypothetical protein VKT73_08985 [Xanthobacteraceae bacterium]|nr:hypothetical protein [Xanthobacteraceae bacterium]
MSIRLRLAQLFGLCAFALLLAGCDRCGDWVRSEGGKVPSACKSDGPKPQ